MNRPIIARILFLSLVMVALGCLTQSAFAAGRGGGGGFHGGGGGFHGGGGYGGGWHGGGGYGGGWHGGGGYGGGWHGGYGGWHGGYGWRGGYGGWGCCGWGWGGGWGWGWGFGISLNFGWPYGGYYGYPYAYGYYPYSYYPYTYYPYPYASNYAPAGNSSPAVYANSPYNQTGGNMQNSAAYSQAGGNFQSAAPAGQFSASVHRPPTISNSLSVQDAVYRPGSSSYTTASASGRTVTPRPVSAQSDLPVARPEVLNVIRALRSMPPAARQQQIESGRYSNLSPHELQLVRTAADVPL